VRSTPTSASTARSAWPVSTPAAAYASLIGVIVSGVSEVPAPPAPSLDGRRFQAAADVPGGDVGAQTVFEYVEDDGVIHARYAGGAIRLGFLVGTREGDTLRFRYAQVRADGSTASGRCESRIEALPDGRLRLHETWAWESQPGEGTSVVEEVI
jgi:hypothetical protein